jgi:hypothetical protein
MREEPLIQKHTTAKVEFLYSKAYWMIYAFTTKIEI